MDPARRVAGEGDGGGRESDGVNDEAGHAYSLRMISYGGRRWVNLDEDDTQVASAVVPDGPDDAVQAWLTTWLQRQLGKVAECDVCHSVRYLEPARTIDLMKYLEWTDLRACPKCWVQVRKALQAGALVRGGQNQPVGRGGRKMETNRLTPDATQDRFASRPDGRGGATSLTPVQLAAEVGVTGIPVRWRWLHDPEGSRYEVSLAVQGEAHRRLLRCKWDRSAARWLTQQDPVAWARNCADLVASGERLVAGGGDGSGERYDAGLNWRVVRGYPDDPGRLQVSLPNAPRRTWLVASVLMNWCDLPPTGLELRAQEIVLLRLTSGPITPDQAWRVIRQGRPLRFILQQPDGTAIGVEPLREWDTMYRGLFPLLSQDEALWACASGMLPMEASCWPRDYAQHYAAYTMGTPARDIAELEEHSALFVREMRAVESGMRALLMAGAVAGRVSGA